MTLLALIILFIDYSSDEESDHSSSGDSEIDAQSWDNMTEDGDGPKKSATKQEKLVSSCNISWVSLKNVQLWGILFLKMSTV